MSALHQSIDQTPPRAAAGTPSAPTDMAWPPMSLFCLGLLTAGYAFSLVVFLTTHDLRSSFVCWKLLVPLLILEQSRRASRLPRVEPRPWPRWAKITMVVAILVAIFIIFDVIDQPHARILPQLFYDLVSTPFIRARSYLTPNVIFTLFVALQGRYLFGEWRYWAKHALDPHRRPSP